MEPVFACLDLDDSNTFGFCSESRDLQYSTINLLQMFHIAQFLLNPQNYVKSLVKPMAPLRNWDGSPKMNSVGIRIFGTQ